MSIDPQKHPFLQGLGQKLPLFPIRGALLLPHARIPINVFEPRYLAMLDWCLAHHRTLVILQPKGTEPAGSAPEGSEGDHLYTLGCAGRVVRFEELLDRRYVIEVRGLLRARIGAIDLTKDGFLLAEAKYQDYLDDLKFSHERIGLDRKKLFAILRRQFSEAQSSLDWRALEQSADETLVTSIAMSWPFSPDEQQALLEAPTIEHRAMVLTALFEMIDAGASSPLHNGQESNGRKREE